MPSPNLLFIYTDEQAFNTLAAYGNAQIEMPNLNRLAEQSIVFEQAYVTQPVCTPSRASLLTGLYPHTSGCTENNMPLPAHSPCLPELLTPGRYVTGHFGKWHLGDELFPQHGFGEWVSSEDAYNGHFSPGQDRGATSSYHNFLVAHGLRPKNGRRFSRGEAARLPEALGKPAFLANKAADFIRRHKADPFVLYVNFLEPHMPFFGPRDGQYPVSSIPLPPNFSDVPGPEHPLKTRLIREHYLRHGHSGMPLRTGADWGRMIANYWGLCSLVDTHIGHILNTLDSCGLRDNTIVVFTSDHGDMMGAHQLLAKCVMYQEAIRVPMMIRLPGQRRGGTVSGPVSQVDLVPTLLDLLEQPIPNHFEGRSLRTVVESGGRATDPVFVEWNGPNNGLGDVTGAVQTPDWMTEIADTDAIRAAMTDPVRTIITADGWKLNCSPLGEHELYHLREDPHETRNVLAEHRRLARKLRGKITKWQRRTGDAVPLPEL